MPSNSKYIVWSKESENDLDEILNHYLTHASEKAHERIINIIQGVQESIFSKQWQVDEYDPTCRRIIVDKKFKVLYKELHETILITRVYPTKKDPDGIIKK